MDPDRRARLPRRGTYARVLLGDGENPGYLRDLSPTGCRLSFVEHVDRGAGQSMEVEVIPDSSSGVEPFAVKLVIKWVRQEHVYCSVGAAVTQFPTDLDQTRYDELLAHHSVARGHE